MKSAIIIAVIALSGCTFLSENRTIICGTADAVCTAATQLCDVYQCDTTVAEIVDDVCRSAHALCQAWNGGTEREIAIARAVYDIDMNRFVQATIGRPLTQRPLSIESKQAAENWQTANQEFRNRYY